MNSSMAMQQLKLSIVSAEDLPDKHYFASGAYVIVTVSGIHSQTFKTPVAKKSTHPKWDDTSFTPVVRQDAQVSFQLYIKKSLGSDILVGMGEMKVDSIPRGDERDISVDIKEPKTGRAASKLMLKVYLPLDGTASAPLSREQRQLQRQIRDPQVLAYHHNLKAHSLQGQTACSKQTIRLLRNSLRVGKLARTVREGLTILIIILEQPRGIFLPLQLVGLRQLVPD